MNEHNAQRLLVAWFDTTYPYLKSLFFAIPNGGKRDKVTAKRLKDEGVRPGIPDLMLARPCGGKNGLFLEMKTVSGRPSEAQEAAHLALRTNGYAVAMPRGYEAAREAIRGYLENGAAC